MLEGGHSRSAECLAGQLGCKEPARNDAYLSGAGDRDRSVHAARQSVRGRVRPGSRRRDRASMPGGVATWNRSVPSGR
jgi:hypothetical protein